MASVLYPGEREGGMKRDASAVNDIVGILQTRRLGDLQLQLLCCLVGTIPQLTLWLLKRLGQIQELGRYKH